MSGGLARPFLVGPVDGLRTWSEALALATATAPGVTDLDGPCTTHLEDWPGDRAALATAVSQTVLDEMYAAARAARVKLVSIRPWWARVATDSLPEQGGVVAIRDSDALTVIGMSAGRPDLASTYSPLPELDQMRASLRRAALSQGNSLDKAVVCSWDAGDGPGAWPQARIESLALSGA